MRVGRNRSGFTLIEMLVVVAITILLLGLIFGPVVQTYNLTRQANAMVKAQDTARTSLEQVSRELGQAMFVYDNSNSPINFPIEKPQGGVEDYPVLYAKVDMLLPRMMMHCNSPSHPTVGPKAGPRDYDRGDEAWPPCPVCKAESLEANNIEYRPAQPLAQDVKVVRYFVGLADNTAPRDWQDEGGPDNGFVLYRAEFDPYDSTLGGDRSAGTTVDLNDPDFFYGQYAAGWKAISQVVGPVQDVDLAKITTNSGATAIESVESSVRFQLAPVTNESLEPAFVSDVGNETPYAIPSVFRSKYGAWGTTADTYIPEPYTITLCRNKGATGTAWYKTAREGGNLVVREYANNTSSVVFNITNYMATGTFTPNTEPPVAFYIDADKGEVRFDFPASDVVNNAAIVAMNQANAASWNSKTSGLTRQYQLTQFAGLAPGGAYKPTVVAGSEIVQGPDMTPDLVSSEIRIVRYQRIPPKLGIPGPNQYSMDYANGVISFSPAFNQPIPERMGVNQPTSISVSYKYQLNQDKDIVMADYATKTLMSITLGIRFYDSNSGKVFPVELNNKVRIRNLMR